MAELLSREGRVLVGPFTFDTGVVVPTRAFDAPFLGIETGLDFDGDGIGDRYREGLTAATLLVYTGGDAGGIVTGVPYATVTVGADRLGLRWLVEDGVGAVVAVREDATIEVVDVGPATAVQ